MVFWQSDQQKVREWRHLIFLRLTHYCDKTRKGKFKLGRKTPSSRFRNKLKAINLWLKNVRNLVELKEW